MTSGQKPSPAAKLSKHIQRLRPKRNGKAKARKVLWTNRIAEHREMHNLAMRDVAKAVGLSLSAYHAIEKGFVDVSLSNALTISQFFGVQVTQLWTQWRGK